MGRGEEKIKKEEKNKLIREKIFIAR